ncbi:hypothetical protein CCACVL1_05206 [Corchorus capsularis]|uniref:Uncharacterized protein n=1 Tax=Corchorus capsularis TaxID=210143 RepID=A0A1R3JLY9_COCAP|nr:hypothetical protein CCACVL1_05206 [Corchorus capsularis]
MAILNSFISCFSASKVASEGDDSSPSPTSTKVDAAAKVELKESNKPKKSPPIPISYFPIGTRFSLL